MTQLTSPQAPGRFRRGTTLAVAWVVAAAGLILPGAAPASAGVGDITRVAGGQPSPGEPATSFGMAPGSVAVDGTSVYVSDEVSHVVWRLDSATGAMEVAAGTGAAGFNGDGGQATSALLNFPAGVAVDPAGNLFIADKENHRVRRVDKQTQVITTIAGTGSGTRCPTLYPQYCLDGLPAKDVPLPSPMGVAVDGAGNVYISYPEDHQVRKVDSANTLFTVAGTGLPGYSGDAGPARSALLRRPTFLAVDASGNLFIADRGNQRVRLVDALDQVITTVAGNGTTGSEGDNGPATSAQLNGPAGLATDTAGYLYIADTYNYRVRRVDFGAAAGTVAGTITGTISTVAGTGTPGFGGDGGLATAAHLLTPQGLAADASGTLYVADEGNHRLRRVDPATQVITTAAGTGTALADFSGDDGPALAAQLSNPTDAAVDASGNLYVADEGNRRIRKVDPSGAITTYAGGGDADGKDNIPATSAALRPVGVDVDASGNLYIANFIPPRIQRVDPAGMITTVAGTGDWGDGGDGGPATSAQLLGPGDVAVDGSGILYITDTYNHRIRRVDSSGTITTVAGTGGGAFSGDDGPATDAMLKIPRGVAVDGSGNLYIADTYNHRVRRVDPSGTITTVAGNGNPGYNGDGQLATNAQLNEPSRLDLDAAGNLFVADSYNHRVRRVDATTGKISTVAGGPTPGFGGDHGPATSARLNRPGGVGFDPSGNLYIADTANHGVRKVEGIGALAPVAKARAVADFGGDGRTDRSVFRSGSWFVDGGSPEATDYGRSGDIALPADYDGDAKADKAVYRPEWGTWYVRSSKTGADTMLTYGVSTDIPVPADYDGDAKADIAILRPSEGTWYLRQSSNGADVAVTFGLPGDIPVVGHYDDDAKADIAVFRPSDGNWYIRNSTTGAVTGTNYGTRGDIPVPADYDGDAKTDLAVFRPSVGTWYIHNSATNTHTLLTYGIGTDVPVPGHYDDDAKADIALFRPATGAWYVRQSTDGTDTVATYGLATDIPLPLPAAIRGFFPPKS